MDALKMSYPVRIPLWLCMKACWHAWVGADSPESDTPFFLPPAHSPSPPTGQQLRPGVGLRVRGAHARQEGLRGGAFRRPLHTYISTHAYITQPLCSTTRARRLVHTAMHAPTGDGPRAQAGRDAGDRLLVPARQQHQALHALGAAESGLHVHRVEPPLLHLHQGASILSHLPTRQSNNNLTPPPNHTPTNQPTRTSRGWPRARA